jgi:rhodanese-related sulfurtransferase
MPEAVDRHELQRLVREEGAQLVEVLPKEEYEEEHLPGAISLPLRRLDREARDVLDPDRPVIVYCWDDP